MEPYALGVDLGGTKIAYALVDRQGQIILQSVESTQAQEGAQAVIGRMANSIQAILKQCPAPIAGIGIGAAGMTDSRRGVVLFASNLKWQDVPLQQSLSAQLGTNWEGRIWVDKDTNAAALGEMFFGAGQGCQDLLYVTLGTGVGGGMILAGRLYHGASEGASDLGHLVLQPDGILCGCGKRGCLETLASGPAIVRAASQAIQQGTPSQLAQSNVEPLTAQAIVAAARQGDALALQCVAEAGTWLGIALAYYVDINNPECIIVGGGVGQAGDLLLEPARRAVAERALPRNASAVRIIPAGLTTHSGVIGAATLVWQHFQEGE